ncbi:uncharacterized protein HMPREF1541_00255 [Cyphellophora europaea CBS 101466]|uniref:Phosphatidylinositol-specific phospholipase C X domain-containing protein n=1 Tax=Cyphellophora europaea (strain CBS 101466) TaxID=1220924 RepID=W2SBF9_CYPE1|nr:uncharacterized protein HMPREF1541_00255 [Cyphellophora europaea CBS 101466]ETN46071.1 hypothetical protein HMPREF1541_00255 [Cyphellophora europaea CBS 101466]
MALSKAGSLNLINATPFDWSKIYDHSYQMSEWDFPEQVKSGDIVSVEVDWSVLGSREDSAGEASYSFTTDTGEDAELQFKATYDGNRQFHVLYENSSTFGNPPGSTADLQWSKDAPNPYVFSGQQQASFASTNPPSDWMHQNLPSIGCQTLSRLCLPASHNSGMSSLNGKTAFATNENTLCQNTDLLGQLSAGFRYFDIRPVIASGSFATGHYSSVSADGIGIDLPPLPSGLPDFISNPIDDITDGSFQGGNGQSIASIISQINDFLANNWELVIINLSHTMDTDHDYVRLSQDQLEDLFEQLLGLKHRFIAPQDVTDLTALPLEDFIKDGPAVLIILDNAQAGEDMKPAAFADQGFYTDAHFPVYNQFANTDNVDDMSRDQLKKMNDEAPQKNDGGLFLLSWTLTTPLDIRASSMAANARLFADVWPVTRDKGKADRVFPNLVMVDGVGRKGSAIKAGGVAALCMAVNSWVNDDCRAKKR